MLSVIGEDARPLRFKTEDRRQEGEEICLRYDE